MEKLALNSCHGSSNGTIASLFLTLVNTLATSKCSLGALDNYPSDYGPDLQDGQSFDFVVVGAGSAGSVVASRLSENPNWKVLLIEAGAYPSVESEVPGLTFHLQNTDIDWKYKCEPSEHVRFKQKIRCPRGKGLGGSSLINYLVYSRASHADYNNWAKSGNVGWGPEYLTPLYDKLENWENGIGGQLNITRYVSSEPIIRSLIDAYEELGYTRDNNDGYSLGRSSGMHTVSNGRRQNVAKAFLQLKERPNLFVVLNSQVSKLLIDPSLHVKGVEVRLGSRLLTVHSKKEVILSAGAVNSPQILMHSGIGPKAHLHDVGITLRKALPVGDNLQDHVALPGLYYKLDKSAIPIPFQKTNLDNLYEYLMHSKGPLASVGTDFFGFVNTKNGPAKHTLEICHYLIPQKFLFSNLHLTDLFDLPKSLTDIVTKVNEDSPITSLLLILSYPQSRGRVRLRSGDPFDAPLILPNYLSASEDVASLIEAVRFVQRMMRTEALAGYKPKFIRFDLPDCDGREFDSDAYWDCVIRNFVRSAYHLTGTCKMGPASDRQAVVDSRLRVHGVGALRVVDGSIMPTLVGVHTNAPIMVIGEKGAQMIREDWQVEDDEL